MEAMRQNMKKCKENERNLLYFISTEYTKWTLTGGISFPPVWLRVLDILLNWY
jgi:hypothetical protein